MINTPTSVRPSPIAGTWYTANPKRLEAEVTSYIHQASLPSIPGEVIALVAPHAGYRYSGAVAGHAFKAIQGKAYEYVAVISPMHQYHPHPLLTSTHHAYRTPLGDIPLAEEKLDQINAVLTKTGLGLTPVANDQEHSLEIELPFLQCTLQGGFNLIPIMIREQTRETASALGKALAETLDPGNCLMIASTDLSHFYPQSKAHQFDNQVLQAITDFSPDSLFDLKDQNQGHACGLAAVAAVLWAAQSLGARHVTLLKYDTSASTTGDHASVVGYAAAAISRPEQNV